MATNLSGNTLTLGSYALTASQSGNVCVNSLYISNHLAGNTSNLNRPISSFAIMDLIYHTVSLTGKWSGMGTSLSMDSGWDLYKEVSSINSPSGVQTYFWLMRVS